MANRRKDKGQPQISSFFMQPTKKLRPNDDQISSSTESDSRQDTFCLDTKRIPTESISNYCTSHNTSNKINVDTDVIEGIPRCETPPPSTPTSSASVSGTGIPSRDVGYYIGHQISEYTKSVLLKNPWTPPFNYDFPYSTRTVSGQTKKNFVRHNHLKSYEDWLVLSPIKKGLFCKYCPWFTNNNEGGFCKNVALKALVTEPLTNFKNLMGKEGDLEKHNNSLYHKNAVSAGKDFLKTFYNPKEDVVNKVNEQRLNQSQENRERLLPIVKTIIVLGRQNIPLRGHRDDGKLTDKNPLHNDGNFRALLRFRVDAGDIELEKHLQTASSRATYISKSTQNDLIECCRLEITETIVQRVLKSRLFSIVFDETPDISTKEQVTLVIRYVHIGQKAEIREDFVSFVDAFQDINNSKETNEDPSDSEDSEVDDLINPKPNLTNVTRNQNELSLTGECLGQIVLRQLKSLQLPLEGCVGIGTDGCSVMLSDKGAVKEIQKSATNAITTPCYNHKLNLSISQSAKVTAIEKTVCLIKEVTSFFAFPKRVTALNSHLTRNLKRLCETRWVERHDGVLQFISSLPSIVQTLDEIKQWKDTNSAGKASVLVGALCDSEFIIGLFCLSDILARTLPLSALLQRESLDLAKAAQVVRDLILDLESRRSGAESHFKDIFAKVNEMAQTLEVEIKKPRTCGRQTKRQNYDTENPEDFFRISTYIPLLESVCTDLKTRFSTDVLDAFKLPLLLPELIINLTNSELKQTTECLIKRFSALLDDDEIVQTIKLNGEISLWKSKWNCVGSVEAQPLRKSAIEVLNLCDKDIFPTIHTLLQVLCTLPASNASAERSFSSLRRLKSWTRATMVQERLVGLALLHIHHDIDVDSANIINRFAKSKKHRLIM